MTSPTVDELEDRMFTVGHICAQWAWLEYVLATAIWNFLNITPELGKIVTGTLDMKGRAAMAVSLAHETNKPPNLIQALVQAKKATDNLRDERNLAVHGVGELRPDGRTYYEIHRGRMKDQKQFMSLIRVHSLSVAIDQIISDLEPIMVAYGIIDTMPPQPGPSR